ncbi:MAG: protein kinase [Trueperaceae bacterium]|nr:protein kinase [Trueperaceae bacterium]
MLTVSELVAGRYQVEKSLGQGGMGAVFLASDRQEVRQVALKVLMLAPGESHLRFRREFRLMSRLSHPHILRVFDSGLHDDAPFLVMEYLTGGTLKEVWPEPPRDVKTLAGRLERLIETAEALGYVHAQGIIHRDLKADNVMIEAGEARLMDFGLAKSTHENTTALTQMGAVMGTATYMSPEQVRGEAVDARSDLYAFGCLLYWTLTGATPFAGNVFTEILIKQLRETPLPPSTHNPLVNERLDELTMRLLEKAPEDRYSAASDVAFELKQISVELLRDRTALTMAVRSPAEIEDATPAQLLNTPLVGHAQTWHTLTQNLNTPSQPLLLQAVPGLGLSRLLGDLRHEARTQGYLVLSLRFYPGVQIPYQAFREALTRLQQRDPIGFAEAAEGLRDVLGPLLQSAEPTITDVEASGDIAKFRFYDAVDQLLVRLGADGSRLALIVDDLHHADEATLALLTYLVRTRDSERFVVFGVHPEAVSPLTKKTLRGLELTRLDLAPLSERDMRDFIRALLGGDVEERLETHVIDHAAGTPMVAKEMLDALLKAGHIARRKGVWEWSREVVSIPPSVEGIWAERVEQLSESAQKTLQIASAVGRDFDFDTLMDLAAADEDDLLDDIDELLRANLIRERKDDHYRFAHPLLRDIMHSALNPRRRRRYHEALAEQLADDPDTPPELIAEHYAETSDPERAVPFALKAARHAMTVFANDVAETYYRLACKVLSEAADEAPQVWLELAQLLDRIGRWDEAEQYYEQAAEAEPTQAKALHGLGKLAQKRGDLQTSRELLEQAIGLEPDNLAAYSDLCRVVSLQGRFGEAEEIANKALLIALKSGGSGVTIAKVQADLGWIAHKKGDQAKAKEWLESAIGRFDKDGDLLLYARLKNLMGAVEYRFGNIEDARENYEHAQDTFQKAGDVERAIVVLQNTAATYGDTGQVKKALKMFEKAYRQADRIGSRDNMARIALNQGILLKDIGECEWALLRLKEARSYYQEFELKPQQIMTHIHSINALLGLEDVKGALQEIESAEELLDGLEQPELMLEVKIEKGSIAIMQADLSQAKLYLEASISVALSLQLKLRLLDIYLLLAGVLVALKQSNEFERTVEAAELLGKELRDDLAIMQVEYLRSIEENNSEQTRELRDKLAKTSQNYFIKLVEKALSFAP